MRLSGSTLRRGQRVLVSSPFGPGPRMVATYIEDLGPDTMTLAPVTAEGSELDVRGGMVLRGRFPSAAPGREFWLNVVRAQPGAEPSLTVTLPDEAAPSERREHVRLASGIGVYAALIAEGGIVRLPSAVAVDISGGGVGLRLRDTRPEAAAGIRHGRHLRLGIDLPGVHGTDIPEQRFSTAAAVVSVAHSADGWHVGTRFEGLSARQREQVVRWCFAEQRRLLRESPERLRSASR